MPGAARWLALGVGLGGVVVLSGGGSGPVAGFAIVACLLAAVSWGVGSALQTRLPVPSRPLLMSGMELLCGGLVLTVVAASRGELTFALDHVSAESWWALLYLIGPGSLLAMTLRLGPPPAAGVSRPASPDAFVNPVVAVLLGLLLLNEHLTAGQALGGALVVMAVAGLLVAPRRRLPSPP